MRQRTARDSQGLPLVPRTDKKKGDAKVGDECFERHGCAPVPGETDSA